MHKYYILICLHTIKNPFNQGYVLLMVYVIVYLIDAININMNFPFHFSMVKGELMYFPFPFMSTTRIKYSYTYSTKSNYIEFSLLE